ncbi:MAG: PorT family protein [Treponema sp.]|nr:PorT family protein [Treponema sp.]
MKKLIALAVSALLFISSTFAIDISVGGRGNLNFGLGTTLYGETDESLKILEAWVKLLGGKVSKGGNVGGGFGVYGNLVFMNDPVKLGVQPEINLNFNNGYHFKYSLFGNSARVSYGVQSIDIPVLVEVGIPINEKFEVAFGIGPQFSIPFGPTATMATSDTATSSKEGTIKYKAKGVNFGMVFDAAGKFFVTEKIGLVGGLRYNLDFTPTKIETSVTSGNVSVSVVEKVFTRRSLNIGVGAEYKF